MKHKHVRPAIVTMFAVFVAMLPYITGNLYYLHVATVIGVYWVLIATLNLLVGFTGQLSVGDVGLLAIGAYAFCLLAGGQGWNPFVALFAGGAICAVIDLVLGLPSLRLPGFYFAMVTLAFGLIVTVEEPDIRARCYNAAWRRLRRGDGPARRSAGTHCATFS